MLRYIKAFIRLIKVEDQIGNSLAFMTGYIYASGFIASESTLCININMSWVNGYKCT
jgi:hypothetical protein